MLSLGGHDSRLIDVHVSHRVYCMLGWWRHRRLRPRRYHMHTVRLERLVRRHCLHGLRHYIDGMHRMQQRHSV